MDGLRAFWESMFRCWRRDRDGEPDRATYIPIGTDHRSGSTRSLATDSGSEDLEDSELDIRNNELWDSSKLVFMPSDTSTPISTPPVLRRICSLT